MSKLYDAAEQPNSGTAYQEDRRALAKSRLPKIIERTKDALAQGGVGVDIFYLLPNSGDSAITYGVIADVSDEEWDTISGIVCEIVKDALALRDVYTRELSAGVVRPSEAHSSP